MRRWLKRIVVTVALLGVVMTSLAWFLGATQTGLRLIVRTVNAVAFKKVTLRIMNARGTLIGGFTIEEVEVAAERAHVVVDGIEGAAGFWSLIGGAVSLDELKVARVRVAVLSHPSAQTQAPKFLPRFLRINVGRLQARDVDITLPNGVHLPFDRVLARLRLTSHDLVSTELDAHSQMLSGQGRVRLIATRPFALSADLDMALTPPRQPEWRGQVRLKGDLERLAWGANIGAPFHATGRGELKSLTKAWQLRGTVVIPDFDVKAWKPDSKLGPAAAALEIGGNHDGYFAAGKVTPRDLGTGTLAVRWRGRYRERVVHFDELAVGPENARGELVARGSIALTGAGPQLGFSADWTNVQWPLRGAATVVSEQGHGTLSGKWPLRFEADGKLQVRDLPAAELTANGEIASGRLTVADAHGRWLDGDVAAQAEIRYGEDAGWTAKASGSHLDPGLWRKPWPGNIDFTLTAKADGLKSASNWQVEIQRLRGRLRKQTLSASGVLRKVEHGFGFDRLAVDLGSTHIRVDGSVTEQVALRWSVSSPDLSLTLPTAAGRLESSGTFAGTSEAFAVNGRIDASGLAYSGVSVRQLTGDVDVDLIHRTAFRGNIAATNIAWGAHEVDALKLALDGTAEAHEWNVSAQLAEVRAALGGHAHYAQKAWSGTLDHWTLDAPDGPHMTLAAPASLTIGSERMELSSACLQAGEERLCAQGALTQPDHWNLQASATRMPLKVFGRRLLGRPELDGYIGMQLAASSEPGRNWTGTARVDLDDADFYYRLQRGQRGKLTLGEARADLSALPDRFTGSVTVRATEKTFLDAGLALTRLRGRALADQNLSGVLRAEIHELGLIPLFVTEVDRVDGTLLTELSLGGTPRAPDLNGTLHIDAKAIDLYRLNLQLRDTKLAAALSGNRLTLDATAHAGDGEAVVKGQLAWNGGLPSGDLALTGKNLRLVNVPEVRIVASPDLKLRVAGRRIDVDGTVTVPYARIAPVELTGAVLRSSDEILVGETVTPPEERFQVYSRVRLSLGDDVRIETFGLAGKLSGGVMAAASPGDPGTGVGELKVDEGKYKVLSRRLDIERGRLLFNGGPLSNPGVDLRAVRHLPDIDVGANVRGTLRAPTLSFFSDPPVSQTQIVALLVSGGTLEQLRSNDTQLVGTTRKDLLIQGGAILASELGAKLGLEDVTLESTKQDQTSLVLGKFLSPRLYVSYGVSLTESINTLKLQYTLGDRFTIRTEAGENQSADVLYTIEK
jgi:translocation and assembly module TamB